MTQICVIKKAPWKLLARAFNQQKLLSWRLIILDNKAKRTSNKTALESAMRIGRMKEIGREMEKLMRIRGPDSSFSPEEAHQFLNMHLSELFEICGEAIQSRLEKTEARAAKAASIKRLAAELEEIQNNKAPLL